MPGTTKPPLGSRVDWGHPLATGIRACWLLNEGSGSSAADNGPYGVRGSASNIDWIGQNGALFNSTSDVITLGDGGATGPLTWSGNVTIVASAKASSYGSKQIIYANQRSDNLWLNINDTGNRFRLYLGGLSTASLLSPSSGLTDGVAYQFGGSWNGVTSFVWVNGVPVASQSTSGSRSTSSFSDSANIGRQSTTAGAFGGTISYVYLWSRALSVAEMAWLYSEPYAFIAPPAPYRKWFVPATAPAVGQPIILRTATIPNLGGSLRQTRF